MKFGQFHFSKGLFGGCDGPIEMTYTCFPPSANDITLLFFAEFCQHFLDFWSLDIKE